VVNKAMRFYVLEAFEAMIFHWRWAYALSEEPKNRGDAICCPICGSAMSMLRWLPPYYIYLSSADPRKWGDFVWGSGINAPLVSARFKEAYERTSLRGILDFRGPVEIVRIGKRRRGDLPAALPTYYIADIERMGPAINPDAEERVYTPGTRVPCRFCLVPKGGYLLRQERTVIDTDTWQGEDIFIARGEGSRPIVSERFKEFVEQNWFTNVWLIPIDYYAYDSPLGGAYIRPEALEVIDDPEFRRQFMNFWKSNMLTWYGIRRSDCKRIQSQWRALEQLDIPEIVAFLQKLIRKRRRDCGFSD
jgi:hypothetical protein